ncbi:MAG: hypothetical protein ACLGXA_00930 [Acidobacteriota bacterium]
MRFAWRLFACTTILATGCSLAPVANQEPGGATPTPLPSEGTSFSGMVHAGPPQQPIAGAKIYLYAVTTGTGVGQASTSRLIAGPDTTSDGAGLPYYVTTDSTGHFHIGSTDYSCGSGGVPEQTYLYSSGGNPGLSPGTNNTAAGLLAVLGTCTNKAFSPTLPSGGVQINEVTTVAAAYALGGFAASPTQISGVQSGTAQGKTGLANAVTMAGMLASIATGQALTPGTNGALVQEKINSLGNSLAACVNTTGPTSGGCQSILPYAGNASDTAQAAINIVHSGGGSVSNAGSIYTASTAYAQFTPHLGAAPNDWTMPITWSNTLDGPQNVAIDASGNAFVTHGKNSTPALVKVTMPAGTTNQYSGNGLFDPTGLAIDNSGNVWVANFNCNGTSCNLSEFNGSTGAPVGGSPFVTDGYTWNVAVSPSANVWITNYSNNSISEFNPSGTLLLDTQNVSQDSGSLGGPDGICIQGSTSNNDIWITNSGGVSGTSVARYNSAGTNYAGSPYTIAGQGPISCAIDSTGQVWTANYGGSLSNVSASSVGRLDNSGNNGQNFTGGGVNNTYGGAYNIAVDGSGNVWTANLGVDSPPATPPYNGSYLGGSISEFDKNGNALSPADGFLYGLGKPDGIAIDGSGNVWVVNDGDGTVIELVGAATPVVTPIAAAVKNNQLGTAP